ncbi:MAG: HAMP domain-containing histidine kinase [Clostridia bacterium]|nr:HAMP domain-containing histidine kinase [Clostridia bacterium]
MKKVIYSNITKALAVILFIASIVSGVLVVIDGIVQSEQEKEYIYGFENEFTDSKHIRSLLEAPQYTILSAYYDVYHKEDVKPELGTGIIEDGVPTEAPETELTTERIEGSKIPADTALLEQRIRERLKDLYCSDRIDYFVEWNGVIFTNCKATTADDVKKGDFYAYVERDADGHVTLDGSVDDVYADLFDHIAAYDTASTLTILASVKQDYANQCKVMWERQEAIFIDTVSVALALAVFALLLLIYLICVCGKNTKGEQKIVWLDYVWAEIHLAFLICLGVAGVALCVWLLEAYFYDYFPQRLLPLTLGSIAALVSAGVLASLLSILRNFKCRRFVASSLILSLLRWILLGFVRAVKWICRKCRAFKNALVGLLSKKTGVLLICMLFVYTVIIGCGVFAFLAPSLFVLWVLVALLAFVSACVAITYRAADLDEIKKGTREVRGGNVTYQIPEPRSEDMKSLAGDINGIAQGLDEAVSASLKAERMKAELITNVSHDLKTPLTSIINYTELLSKVEGLPEEARDYVQIIAIKNERLKNLTQDLFAISKVQSGNEEVVWEKLDVALLVEQAMAELEGDIQNSGLPFCVHTPKELYITADGRKMSRVVGNLLNNVLKYTMKNTRVFITAAEKNSEIVLEFKNISAHPMDFEADEIVGRFVRGDESRTTEGSGLGLAIAKSYTELCGGRFEIILDGDLFKAVLTFPTCTSAS